MLASSKTEKVVDAKRSNRQLIGESAERSNSDLGRVSGNAVYARAYLVEPPAIMVMRDKDGNLECFLN